MEKLIIILVVIATLAVCYLSYQVGQLSNLVEDAQLKQAQAIEKQVNARMELSERKVEAIINFINNATQ